MWFVEVFSSIIHHVWHNHPPKKKIRWACKWHGDWLVVGDTDFGAETDGCRGNEFFFILDKNRYKTKFKLYYDNVDLWKKNCSSKWIVC